jgi:hypothetical protein
VTATFTVMLAVLLALMRHEKIVAGIGLEIVCFLVVAALGCIVYWPVFPAPSRGYTYFLPQTHPAMNKRSQNRSEYPAPQFL